MYQPLLPFTQCGDTIQAPNCITPHVILHPMQRYNASPKLHEPTLHPLPPNAVIQFRAQIVSHLLLPFTQCGDTIQDPNCITPPVILHPMQRYNAGPKLYQATHSLVATQCSDTIQAQNCITPPVNPAPSAMIQFWPQLVSPHPSSYTQCNVTMQAPNCISPPFTRCYPMQ